MKERSSNIELLRIVTMVLVMVVHAAFMADAMPTEEVAHTAPVSTFVRFSLMGLSCVCVDVFVLISGWFGIHFQVRKLLALVFQVAFFSVLVYAVLVTIDRERYTTIEALGTFLLQYASSYWFVKAYVGLFLLAPALNLFLDQATQKQLTVFLAVFYCFQIVYGWFFIEGSDFNGGYSTLSFVGLYVLAGWYRRYGQALWQPRHAFLLYGTIALGLATVAFAVTYCGFPVSGRLFTYTQPLVIVEALCLLLAFSRLKLQSRIVNWIAASCFAVYLLHGNEFLLRPIYGKQIHEWFVDCGPLEFIAYTSLYLAAWFVAAILLDKARLAIWNGLVERKCHNS